MGKYLQLYLLAYLSESASVITGNEKLRARKKTWLFF